MIDLLTNRLALRGLYAAALGRAFLRYKNPRRQQAGRHHTEFYARIWRDTADKIGATWRQLTDGISEIELDGVRTRVFENVSEIDDPVTLTVLHDKPLTHQLLVACGLPVPMHATFTLDRIAPAKDFLRSTSRNCVIKPASGTGGGRGVTTGIRTLSHLARASAAAAVYGDELMIEEQIDGDNYRLLYLDGELIDAFVRRLPAVVADGRSSIKSLVAQHNDRRLRERAGVSQVLLTVDLDMRRTLQRQGLSLRSVPAEGQSVTLKTVVNENSGVDNSTVMDQLSPAIVEQCARAVRALRVRFAGIDIVTSNPGVSLDEAGGVILEVNGTPNLYYHYNKKDGAFPVAEHLLARLLPSRDRGGAYRGTELETDGQPGKSLDASAS
jgi:cyanophycin synthetase